MIDFDPSMYDAFLLPHLIKQCTSVCEEIDQAKPVLEKLKAKVQDSVETSERRRREGYPLDFCYNELHYRGLQDSVSGEIRRLTDKLYRISRRLPPLDPQDRNSYEIMEDNYQRYAEGVYGIRMFQSRNDAGDDVILIKLPMLEPEALYFVRAGKRNFPFCHSEIYSKEVADGMELLIAKDPEIIRRYAKKTISFFFVYETNDNVLDSNNHDTKLIVDAITGSLFGGDAAICCSFSYETLITNSLAGGTYICLSPGKSNFANEEILKKFEQDV